MAMEGRMHSSMQTVTHPTANTKKHGTIAPSGWPALRDSLDALEQFGATIIIRHDGTIVGQGDAAEFCYKILSGCVRRVKLMEDGRRHIGEFLLPDDLFGFDDVVTYDLAAEAVSDVVLR